MPETAVDEHNRPVLGENDVWLAGEILAVDPETEPHAVQQRTDNDFRLRILGPNP